MAVLLFIALDGWEIAQRRYILAACMPGTGVVTGTTSGIYRDAVYFDFQTGEGKASSGFSHIGWGGRAKICPGQSVRIHYCEGRESSLLSWAALDDDHRFTLTRLLELCLIAAGAAFIRSFASV